LPQEESDKPVQFWQLRKNGNKVCSSVIRSFARWLMESTAILL
jgi:hypothetical protein